ncbi:hypothetical protein TNCT_484381 [Trichonephila clavata]|uniref:Uncharacterized protein n=1 Tax=Trichonephila clavata TaxID=2740835 RepID=A0A8X6F4U4_TRICU|nr:hypothetical protein TNCT_484381 [Trichonephila clavata]
MGLRIYKNRLLWRQCKSNDDDDDKTRSWLQVQRQNCRGNVEGLGCNYRLLRVLYGPFWQPSNGCQFETLMPVQAG